MVGLLLSRSTHLLKVPDKSGQTCLHVAASSGHYEMVQVLLGQGSDYSSVDKVNQSSKYCNYEKILNSLFTFYRRDGLRCILLQRLDT